MMTGIVSVNDIFKTNNCVFRRSPGFRRPQKKSGNLMIPGRYGIGLVSRLALQSHDKESMLL